jgi:hypothetical protein
MKSIVILIALLLPLVAQAGKWARYGNTSKLTNGLQAGEWASFDPTSGDVDPVPLNLGSCENFDVFYYVDVDGGTPDSTSTVALYTCPGDTSDTDACQPLNAGTTLTASATEVFGASAIWLFADVDAFNADARIIVKCAQPSQR